MYYWYWFIITGFVNFRYKEQYVETMAGLVEFAQGAYNTRQHEIKLFKDLVISALADSVENSKE